MVSVQPRELPAKHGTRRVGAALLGFCAAAGISYGCGSSPKGLFGEPTSGGVAGQGGTTLGGSAGSGGATVASGGAPVTSGGATVGSGGSDPGGVGGAGGDGSSGDPDLGGNGGSAAAGGIAGGGASGGIAGGGASGGVGGVSGGAPPVLQSGSQALPGFQGLHCESVSFPTAFAAPAANIHVQASSVHPAATLTHGALAVRAQSVTSAGFEVCLIEDTDLNGSHLVSRLDWVAYVAPSVASLGVKAGRLALGAVSGRSCQSVSFPAAFGAVPQVQVTLNHQGSANSSNDPASVWLEELEASGFRVCVEELEDTDGELEGTNVDWLAYPSTFAGAGFTAGEHEVRDFDGVECVEIETGCANCENVQVSVNHRRRTESATSSHNAILVWAEDMTATGLVTVCLSETSAYDGQHDAHLSISWLARQKND